MAIGFLGWVADRFLGHGPGFRLCVENVLPLMGADHRGDGPMLAGSGRGIQTIKKWWLMILWVILSFGLGLFIGAVVQYNITEHKYDKYQMRD